MKNLENRILSIGLTFCITTASLTGCNIVEATNRLPKISSESLLEITPRPTISPEPSPTPEPTLTPIPTPTEIPPTPTPEPSPTPEILANPSKIVTLGNRNNPEIAFTFDDSGANLEKIVKVLDEKEIKSTFFLLEGELKRNPDFWRKAVENGHQICNHTVGHRMDLPKLSEAEMKKEILGWEMVAKQILGEDYVKRMKRDFPYFRAPGGNKSEKLQQVLGNLGYPITAYWTAEDCYCMEPTHNPNNYTLEKNYAVRSKNGAIYLLHGGSWDHVAKIIENAEAKGFSFKLLSEILD